MIKGLNLLQRKLTLLLLILIILGLIFFLAGEIDNFKRYIFGVERGVVYNQEDLSGLLTDEVQDRVYQHAKEVITYPKDATLDKETAQIKPSVKGEIVAITETVEDIMQADNGAEIRAKVYAIKPLWLKEDLEKLTKNLSQFRTVIGGSQARKENIKLAVSLINNEVVFPKEEFSFNRLVGPRTEEHGFKKAVEIIEGEFDTGVGGGICQVSTTLYNAAIKLGLEITERNAHSKGVSYVDEGKDAAVAWDYFDLRFKNNLATPVLIKANVYGNILDIKIIGPW